MPLAIVPTRCASPRCRRQSCTNIHDWYCILYSTTLSTTRSTSTPSKLHSSPGQSSDSNHNVIDLTSSRSPPTCFPPTTAQSASTTTVFLRTAFYARERLAENTYLHCPSRRDSSHSVSIIISRYSPSEP